MASNSRGKKAPATAEAKAPEVKEATPAPVEPAVEAKAVEAKAPEATTKEPDATSRFNVTQAQINNQKGKDVVKWNIAYDNEGHIAKSISAVINNPDKQIQDATQVRRGVDKKDQQPLLDSKGNQMKTVTLYDKTSCNVSERQPDGSYKVEKSTIGEQKAVINASKKNKSIEAALQAGEQVEAKEAQADVQAEM